MKRASCLLLSLSSKLLILVLLTFHLTKLPLCLRSHSHAEIYSPSTPILKGTLFLAKVALSRIVVTTHLSILKADIIRFIFSAAIMKRHFCILIACCIPSELITPLYAGGTKISPSPFQKVMYIILFFNNNKSVYVCHRRFR